MARFPSVGEEFGSYRIVRRLGRGGMGVVFAAEHRGLGRTVALKVLSPELAGQADYRTRFSREATVLARLDSPHVVQVLDHGEHDGCLYIATQYVAGGDLAQALRRHGPVPVAQAAEIAEQVAWALADSHAAGVVHRDIKPSNVLLREVSAEVFAYLCDFGIAQDREPGLTATGAVAGTFAYLAPERLRGEPATAAADVYALGCVLFTSLVGSAPYGGSDVEIGMGHLHAPVPQLVGGSAVADSVNAVLRRSMAKDPAARYPDARAMRQDLRELAGLARTSPAVPLVALTPLGHTRVTAPRSVPSTPSAPVPPYAAPAPATPPPPAPPPVAWSPGPPARPPQPKPARRRRGVLVAIAAVVVAGVLGGTAIAVVAGGSDGGREAGPTTGPTSEPTTDPTTDPTSDPTAETPTLETPTPEPTPDPPAPPRKPQPRPTYPNVAPASGFRMSYGLASVRVPAGWGRVDADRVEAGVGARNYDDGQDFRSSVFVGRTKPRFPLDDVDLLKIATRGFAESVDKNDPGITLRSTQTLSTAWLDGERAVRVQAVYYSKEYAGTYVEETWFAQHGSYLYLLSFQHGTTDSVRERHREIDPMIVAFRWRRG